MIIWKEDKNIPDSNGQYWSGWLKMPMPSPWVYLRFFEISPRFFGSGFKVKTWLGRKRKTKCGTIEQDKAICDVWLENILN